MKTDSGKEKVIRHSGRVLGVSGERVDVLMVSESACASCKVKSACGMSESTEKLVTVCTPYAAAYREGEEVFVSIRQSMGMKAVFYVYMLPFLLVLGALIALIEGAGVREEAAGLAALGVLAVYYGVLWLFRRRIEREISFEIEKIR